MGSIVPGSTFHIPVYLSCLLLILASVCDVSHASSRILQPSHSSGMTATPQYVNVSQPIKPYDVIINSGQVTLESTISTTARYLGPGSPLESSRIRRDTEPLVGAVYENFAEYTPFGRSSDVIHMATFTDGDFNFQDGTYTAPYSGHFFFLVHIPTGTDVVELDLGWTDEDGIRTPEVDMTLSINSHGVFPVVLSLSAEDTVDVYLTGVAGMNFGARFSSVFNIFDLYHSNIVPTHFCFPHLMRQSAFTVTWNAPLSATLLSITFPLETEFTTVTNIGSNFDITTGIYTAELPGIYAFFLSFEINNPRSVSSPAPTSISITRNGVRVATAGADASGVGVAERVSTAIVIQLSKGDEIQLVKDQLSPPIAQLGISNLLIFTGFLL